MTGGDALSQERLQRAVPRLAEALHALARELELTNDELFAALAFIGEVGRADELILLSDVLGLSRLVDDQTHAGLEGTASNVSGPFYVPDSPWIDNPGSVVRTEPSAERIIASGTVRDARGRAPIAGATVDVWQANEHGVYSTQDPSLPVWHLRGRQHADSEGSYSIETVAPLHYTVKDDGPVGRLLAALGRHPFRPAHIHFLVSADGYRSLMTQLYVAGGPYLEDDAISGVKPDLVAAVEQGRIRFDIELVLDQA